VLGRFGANADIRSSADSLEPGWCEVEVSTDRILLEAFPRR
jgi:hypothetical protein